MLGRTAKGPPKTIDVDVTLVFHTAKDAFIRPHVATVKAAVERALEPVSAQLKTRNVIANLRVISATTPPADKDILAIHGFPATKRAYWIYVLSDEQLATHLLLKHVEAIKARTEEARLRQGIKVAFSATGFHEGMAFAGAGIVPAKLSFELTKSEVVHLQNVVIHELGHAISRRDQNPGEDHGSGVMKADLTDDDGPLGYPASFVKRLASKIEGAP